MSNIEIKAPRFCACEMNESIRPAAWWDAINAVYEQGGGQVQTMKNQVPYYEAPHLNYQELPCMNNNNQQHPIQSYTPSVDGTEFLYSPSSYDGGGGGGGGFDDGMPPPAMDYGQFGGITTYPPCQGPRPWNFAYCYGYYGEPACPMINMVDMEDFM